jgi:riboflavin synthase
MFTGLVEAVGELVERTPIGGGFRLRVASPLAAELSPGDSLAVNGVCLTVTVAGHDHFQAEIGPETSLITTLGTIGHGSVVNLERPLRADGRLGGHFVQGHVDEVGHLQALRADADFHWATVSFSSRLAPFLVHRGSIAVDGISLTIAGLADDRFDVQVVPFTMSHTNLGRAAPGAAVNIEADIVGKYVARAAELAGLTTKAVHRGDVAHQHQA